MIRFWQRQAWAGVIASESLSLCEDIEDSEIKALYQFMPVQCAASNMFDPAEFPYLCELCTLDQNGVSRGRIRQKLRSFDDLLTCNQRTPKP